MGGNASPPTMADCCLAVLEYKFIMSKKVDFSKTDKFIARYMDDLLVVNFPNFLKISKEIYPRELQLEQTIIHNRKINFLDLTLEIAPNGKFITTVFDKTEAFNFEVIKFTHVSSNAPQCIAYGVFFSQLIRNARICSTKNAFVYRNKILFEYLLRRGFDRAKLIKTICIFAENYKVLLYKLNVIGKSEVIDIIIKL